MGCLPADLGVAPVPAGLGWRQQRGGESGQTSLLRGLALGSGMAAGWSLLSGQLHPCWLWAESLQPKEWLLTVMLSCDSLTSFAPITLPGSISSLVSPCLGGFCSLLGPWWVEGTLEERKGAEIM